MPIVGPYALMKLFLSCLIAVSALAACGGGGGGDDDTPTAFDSAGPVVVADLDGDGLLDVAAGVTRLDGAPPHRGRVKVWLQQAESPGSFELHASYPVGADPSVLRLADIDGDGRADLVAMSAHASADETPLVDQVTLLRADPARPGAFLSHATLHALSRLSDIAIGDLDGNGLADIAFTAYDAGARVGVWWNDAASPGSFADAQTLVSVAGGALVSADLNADGLRDLAYVADASAWLLARDPASARRFAVPQQLATVSLPTCLETADLDRDGRNDLLLGSRDAMDFGAPGQMTTLRQDPAQPGSFAVQQRLDLQVHAWQCVAADLDGNGWPDLATTGMGVRPNLFDDVVELFLDAHAAAPGRLAAPVRTVTRDTSSGLRLAVGDLDGDGRGDVAMPYEDGVLLLRQDPAHPGALLRWRDLR